MNKKTVYIIIWNILSIYILVSSLSYHNVIAEDITINENSGVSPKDLFLKDPTNPTQVLKAEINQKKDQLVSFSPRISNDKE
ncbi:MAG: hypothetical protein ACTSQ6_10095, partial [Candidatus Heimdallarchaeaceae archaeon]